MMLRRAWPPVYSAPAPPPAPPVNYAPLPPPDYYYNKGREYYFLAPLYRDALPPPPPPRPLRCPCSCLLRASRQRSRSLDTVASEALSDSEDVLYEVKKPPRPLLYHQHKRRSMEDLLDTTRILDSNRIIRKHNRVQEDFITLHPQYQEGLFYNLSNVRKQIVQKATENFPSRRTGATQANAWVHNDSYNQAVESGVDRGDVTVSELFVHQHAIPAGRPAPETNENRPRFIAVTTLEDVQAVRCAEFHPNGNIYAVGSNSKTLRICAYPKLSDLREDHSTFQPTVLFKRTRHHKGSIYCMAWTPVGDLMATGSNDKTVKLMRFNPETSNLEGQEIELTMHDGTVRDVCFLEDSSNKSSLLISGGAGDCKIYVTDCATGQAYQALSGHAGHVLSLYNWGGAMFVSGSHDRTVRFWDLRTRGCVNVVTPITNPQSRQGNPVAAICVDPSGRLLVSGHEDSACVLYDIRGGRSLQCFKPHTSDVRSIRFSPSAYYLLTAGYDNKLVLTDLQGDLTTPLPSVVVAQHSDKVISGRWHPTEFSFLSTSADKTATLWALPPL